MKLKSLTILAGAVALLIATGANACPDCWWDHSPSWHESERDWRQGMPSMRRHHLVMRQGIPEAYRDLTNPLEASNETLALGERLYKTSCASCHGEQGRGDGPAAEALTPRPASLHHLGRMSMMMNDAYLYWTVAEGGGPVASDMPSFNDTLSQDEIWSVVHYMRRGL